MGLHHARFSRGSSAIKSAQDVQDSLLLLNFGYLNKIALLAFEDAPLLKHYL